MHNAAFWATGYNGTFMAVESKESGNIVSGIKALGIQGASITIPHKETVVSKLDELDPQAKKMGAVNTIVNRNGKLKGYNTDGEGLLRALRTKTEIQNTHFVILGAGGAARAAAFSISAAGGTVTICNRSAMSGGHLAAELKCKYIRIEELTMVESDVLINTTPVGMSPNEGVSVVPSGVLHSGMIVMDVVYNPLRTRLLLDAAAAGCETIDGSEMFIHQGARQFEIWTDLEAPVDIMRLFVHAALEDRK